MSINAEYVGKSRASFTITFLLLLAIVGLVSYVIYKEIKEDDEKSSKLTVDSKRDVLFIYGDFFKTAKEQKDFERKFSNESISATSPPVKNGTDPSVHNTVCSGLVSTTEPSIFERPTDENRNPFQLERRRRRSSKNYKSVTGGEHYIEDERHHGCCTSRRKFISPPSAVSDQNGQTLYLVHFDNDRQYFLSQDCWHNFECIMDCGCRQQIGLYRALVHNPQYNPNSESHHPRYVVRMIRVPGGCKCMNNLPPPYW